MPGKTTLKPEINISSNGVWLLYNDHEYFLDYKNYPWFLKATVADIYKIETPQVDHLYWPTLDIDLSINALKNPEKYPLIYKE